VPGIAGVIHHDLGCHANLLGIFSPNRSKQRLCHDAVPQWRKNTPFGLAPRGTFALTLRYLSAPGFCSEGKYCQNGRRCKNQRYVVHNHYCHLK
jgi:hypothetical protein